MREQKNFFQNLIREICEEEHIKMTVLSNGWILVLEKEGQCQLIVGNKFELNSYSKGCVCDDKYALYELLHYYHFPVVPHHLVYPDDMKKEYTKNYQGLSYLKGLFHQYDNQIVLKPNRGKCGIDVSFINKEEDLEKTYFKLSKQYESLSLSPYMDIMNEYRVILLKGKVLLTYKKERPIIYGDGKHSIKELLKSFHFLYFKDYHGEDQDRILKEGEKYVYDWKFNLSKGARASFAISSIDKEKIESLAEKVAQTLDLGFVSIDIIKTIDQQYLVLEINSGVTIHHFIDTVLDGDAIAKKVYHQAICSLFKR